MNDHERGPKVAEGLTVTIKAEGAKAIARKLKVASWLLRYLPQRIAAWLWKRWISDWQLTIWARAGDADRGEVWSRRLGEAVRADTEGSDAEKDS